MITLPVRKDGFPNYTLVLPGGCNATCKFCYWTRDKASEMNPAQYAVRAAYIAFNLPQDFGRISISGAEPTLSPAFTPLMSQLSVLRDRFNHIVLTTNGINLLKRIDEIKGIVDYVNISRHHYIDSENDKVFGSKQLSTDQIENLISELDAIGIPVQINAVTDGVNLRGDMNEFATWARMVGANSLQFRIESGIMDPIPAHEEMRKTRKGTKGGCPVCWSEEFLYKGLRLSFKYSEVEPSKIKEAGGEGVYETVLQPSGDLTTGWDPKSHLLLAKDQDPVGFWIPEGTEEEAPDWMSDIEEPEAPKASSTITTSIKDRQQLIELIGATLENLYHKYLTDIRSPALSYEYQPTTALPQDTLHFTLSIVSLVHTLTGDFEKTVEAVRNIAGRVESKFKFTGSTMGCGAWEGPMIARGKWLKAFPYGVCLMLMTDKSPTGFYISNEEFSRALFLKSGTSTVRYKSPPSSCDMPGPDLVIALGSKPLFTIPMSSMEDLMKSAPGQFLQAIVSGSLDANSSKEIDDDDEDDDEGSPLDDLISDEQMDSFVEKFLKSVGFVAPKAKGLATKVRPGPTPFRGGGGGGCGYGGGGCG